MPLWRDPCRVIMMTETHLICLVINPIVMIYKLQFHSRRIIIPRSHPAAAYTLLLFIAAGLKMRKPHAAAAAAAAGSKTKPSHAAAVDTTNASEGSHHKRRGAKRTENWYGYCAANDRATVVNWCDVDHDDACSKGMYVDYVKIFQNQTRNHCAPGYFARAYFSSVSKFRLCICCKDNEDGRNVHTNDSRGPKQNACGCTNYEYSYSFWGDNGCCGGDC